MAKKSYKSYMDEVEDETEEVTLVESKPTSYNKIGLVNKISAKVKLQGAVTGEFYIWEKAGAVVEVDERDAPDLLAKKLGEKHCCGGGPTMLFEIQNY